MRNFIACQKTKNAKACSNFEYSVPFIPESYAKATEEALSRAWNDFDARSTWYANSLMNARPDPANPPR